jgi:hypothetical protein
MVGNRSLARTHIINLDREYLFHPNHTSVSKPLTTTPQARNSQDIRIPRVIIDLFLRLEFDLERRRTVQLGRLHHNSDISIDGFGHFAGLLHQGEESCCEQEVREVVDGPAEGMVNACVP